VEIDYRQSAKRSRLKIGEIIMNKSIVVLTLVSALLMHATVNGATDVLNPIGESDAELEQRMAWFNDARFGMFIHWGAYSVLGGEWQGKPVGKYAEWIRHTAKIGKADYREVCKQFQPDKFDADAWIRAARDAGMKYFVITTKHHDGFCLWDSAYTDYDIKDLAGLDFDPLAELSAACKKYGLRFGTYYSIIDWEYPTTGPGFEKANYVQYMKDQVRELIEKYDTDILWFDGDWKKWWTLEDGADLYAYIRALKPSIIINNRVSKRAAFKRDFGTPEQTTPGMDLGYDWEACWTINHSWGFKKADTKWKSTQELVEKLSDIVSKGGNLLLNVGPKPDGAFPEASIEQLREMGQWMQLAGEGIYGSDSSKIPQPSWGRLTQKRQSLYLHVFDWPADGKLLLEGVKLKATRASLLGATEQALRVTSGEAHVEIILPAQKPGGLVPMIRLDFEGEVEAIREADQLALKEGDLRLTAHEATIRGKGPLRVEGKDQHLGYWVSNDNLAQWEFENVSQDAVYDVEIVYALDPEYAGAEFLLSCGASSVSATVPATKGWNDYQTLKAGRLSVPGVGRTTVSLMKQGEGRALFNLKAIILRQQ
jgi:alpha-L-fucosidase